MPGIAGILGRKADTANAGRAAQMTGSMLHEPFYTTGTVSAAELGFHAGWVAHAGSYTDGQTVWNETREVGVLFAGEHYADASENARLRQAGHVLSDGDASCLAHLYEEQGANFLPALNGTFSGAIIDRRQGRVTLFTDRFGLGRMYVHQGADGFYFASEAKAILRVLPALRRLDERALGELLTCGCTLQDRTLFPDISILPAGAAWVFEGDATGLRLVKKTTYFDRGTWENQTPLSADAYLAELKACFARILPRYFSGRQKVALSVTGGLDSRMIIAHATPGSLPCYTFGGTYRDSEDVRIGRLVAQLCQQTHGVIPVDQHFIPQYLELARRCVYMTDGTMDVSGSVGLYVNRLARDYAPVRMTGNYGSEILRGNAAFKASALKESPFTAAFGLKLGEAATTYRAEKEGLNRLSFIAYKQVPWHHYSRLSEEQSQLTIRAPYLDNELVPLAYRAPDGLLLNKQLAYQYTTDVQPALRQAPTDRGLLDRPKLVPTKLYELSKEIRPKAEYYFDYGMPNWLAKVDRVFSPLHLERLFLGQQKYYHFRIWYRTVLAEQIKSVLLDPASLGRPYVDRRKVEHMVNSHTRGTGNYTLEIHKLMTLELIQRTLIEGA